MKIVFINNRFGSIGGAERYVKDVALELSLRGESVTVIHSENDLFKDNKYGIKGITSLDPELLKKEIQDLSPDIVFIHNIENPELLNVLGSLAVVVPFVHDHHYYCPGNSKLWFRSNKVCTVPTSLNCGLRAFTEKCMTRNPIKILPEIVLRRNFLSALKLRPKILCNSHYVAERLIQNGLDGSRVEIIPLFPGGEVRQVTKKEEIPETPEILFVGRVFIEKGVEYLLRAVRHVNQPFKLIVVGDGWDLQRCKSIASALGISKNVNFLGELKRNEIDKYYARCRMVVVPSIWPEPFGMTGLEGFSFEKPCIAFNVGGIPDWLEDSTTGYLVERGDVCALADRISLLLANKDEAERLGLKARKKVEDVFNIGRHTDRLIEIFRSVIV